MKNVHIPRKLGGDSSPSMSSKYDMSSIMFPSVMISITNPLIKDNYD